MNLTVFAREALANFRTVAAVAPSSRYLTRAMLQPLRLEKSRCVVELGSGTGIMTQALLTMIPADATLLAFEINPRFSEYLLSNISDPRLVLINASAAALQEELHRIGVHSVDAVVSSLGLSFMTDSQRHELLSQLTAVLDRNGGFTQFHYSHGLQLQNGQLKRFAIEELLQNYFRSVHRKIIWRNLPPAFVYGCTHPLRADTFDYPPCGDMAWSPLRGDSPHPKVR